MCMLLYMVHRHFKTPDIAMLYKGKLKKKKVTKCISLFHKNIRSWLICHKRLFIIKAAKDLSVVLITVPWFASRSLVDAMPCYVNIINQAAESISTTITFREYNIILQLPGCCSIPGVTKRYGTNFRTHSSHLEDEIMLYEHGSGNALIPLK